jgi:photosystem II stability/assembly factor-like uncharacterized protein
MLDSGGEDSSIWKSSDGGDTWIEITGNQGLPKGPWGKVGVAAAPRAGRVWAIIEAKDGGVYRSDDGGETWQLLNPDMDLRRRPWYYMHIYADPQDPDTLWNLNLACWKSIDGGKTFEQIPTPHGDNHGLWIDPRDSKRMIESNDGGANVSFDGGRTWSSILNQPTAQFYHVTVDDQVPYHVYGPQQDNWAMRLPSIDFEGAISWKDYVEPGGGESGYLARSPNPPHIVFGGGIGTGLGHGRLIAWNPETGQKRNVTPWPELHGFGAGAEHLKYRFQWTFPVEFSPHDPNALYVTSNYVHVSRDLGMSWEVISPDLTRNDPDKLKSSGGVVTADNSGAEIYCTIFAFKESPHEAGVFWAGTDDGLVHVSRDGGKNWTNVTPSDNSTGSGQGLPEWSQIMIVEPSPHDKATCYVCATRYKHDDWRPFLYKTNDYGQSWTKIVGGIPDHEFTRVIREDPGRRGLLFTGTETGIYVSFDDGFSWTCMTDATSASAMHLPVTPIHDIVVKDSDLVVATHGRSFWILDDITPLRHIADATPSSEATLLAPRDTPRFRMFARAFGQTPGLTNYMMTGPVTVAYTVKERPNGGRDVEFLDAGKNPPDGVIVHYYLPEQPKDTLTLEFLDASGEVVRSFSSKPKDETQEEGEPALAVEGAEGAEELAGSEGAEGPGPVEDEERLKLPANAGMNRFVWDMRYRKPTPLKDAAPPKGFAALLEEFIGPRAIPGTYSVRLTVGGQAHSAMFQILPDPRLPVTQADLQAQFELKMAIRDQLSAVHETVNQVRKIRKQVEMWEEHLKDSAAAAQVKEAGKALKERLKQIEDALVQPEDNNPKPEPSKIKEKLAGLSIMIDESDDPPTKGAREVFEMLGEQVDTHRQTLIRVLDGEVARFNKVVADAKPQAVVV